MRENRSANAARLESLAFLYVNGELDASDRRAFERYLAVDQTAREALGQAVEFAQVFSGRTSRKPKPEYRERVRARLLPGGFWGWLTHRSSLGHPLLWTTAGAAAALVVILAWPRNQTTEALAPPDTEVVRAVPAPPPPAMETAPTVLEKEARVYTELQKSDHLVNAVAEIKGRRERWPARRPMHEGARPTKSCMKQG